MKLGLRQTTKQCLQLGYKMQQAIRLLQLSSAELDAEIKIALADNAMLELTEEYTAAEQINAAATMVGDWDNGTIQDPSLHDHLYWQINLTPFTNRDKTIAICIVDSINDAGYLSTSIEDLHNSLRQNYPEHFNDLEIAEVIAVLHRVQQFDPLGVGARDLQECLLIQLAALDTDSSLLNACKQLVTNHLELLGKKDYAQIIKLMQIDPKCFAVIQKILLQLNPKPGTRIATNNVEFLIPDVIAQKVADHWLVKLNKNSIPNLRLNANYSSLKRSLVSERDAKFLHDQLNEAKWFIQSIQTRNNTLLKVASYIVRYQKDFLETGATQMRPLTLQQIANDLHLSESTISRITTRKYLHTPCGIYELKFFFSSHVVNMHGKHCSSTAVKAIIKRIIDQEAGKRRLSDQKIARIMANDGIIIARRTVTKYRESLGIQPSNQRGA